MRPSAHSHTLKPDATCSHASPHSSSSAPQASCSSSLSPRLKPCRRHTDCPFSPHRAFKTITYTTPRQPSPRSGPGPVPHITGVASHCFQDIPFTLSYVVLIPLSLRTSNFPFYLVIRHGTTPLPLLARSVLGFPLAWPRPRGTP